MMINRHIGTLFVTLSSMAFVSSAFANGMRLSSQDGFATARGEAFAATADNASAIYYNPAGLTQFVGSDFRGGLYGIYFDPSYRPPATAPNAGNTYHIRNNYAVASQFFFAHSLKDLPLSYGLGVYAPFGLGVTWPQNTGFRAVGVESSLIYLRINPAMALKLPYNFSFGAGVSANYSRIDLEQGLLPFRLPLTNFFRFTGSGWAVGYNLGLLWQPHEKISFGTSFRSSTTVKMEGRTEFEQFPFPNFYPGQHRSAHATFEFPLSAVFAVSYRPTPKWNVEFDADYTDWSSFGIITIHQSNPPAPLTSDNDLTLNWQGSWLYAFGVTRYLDNGWRVSAGYTFNENSVPDAYYTPLVADLDRHFFSVGFGRQGKRWNFDVAYQFGFGPTRTVTGSTPSSLSGTFTGQSADGKYDFVSHAVLLTLGARF